MVIIDFYMTTWNCCRLYSWIYVGDGSCDITEKFTNRLLLQLSFHIWTVWTGQWMVFRMVLFITSLSTPSFKQTPSFNCKFGFPWYGTFKRHVHLQDWEKLLQKPMSRDLLNKIQSSPKTKALLNKSNGQHAWVAFSLLPQAIF